MDVSKQQEFFMNSIKNATFVTKLLLDNAVKNSIMMILVAVEVFAALVTARNICARII